MPIPALEVLGMDLPAAEPHPRHLVCKIPEFFPRSRSPCSAGWWKSAIKVQQSFRSCPGDSSGYRNSPRTDSPVAWRHPGMGVMSLLRVQPSVLSLAVPHCPLVSLQIPARHSRPPPKE